MTSKEQVERDFMQWVRDNHFGYSEDTNGNIQLSKRRVMELFIAARRAHETSELHWPLIDTALQGAANALPVLFTMLTKAGLREGAMVADEINGNVLCAIKQLAHGRRCAPETTAKAVDDPISEIWRCQREIDALQARIIEGYREHERYLRRVRNGEEGPMNPRAFFFEG